MLTLDPIELSQRIDEIRRDVGAGFHESKRMAIRQMLLNRAKTAQTTAELRDIVEYVIAYML